MSILKKFLRPTAKFASNLAFLYKRNIITFISYPAYSDNTKAVYEYIRSRKLDKKYDIELLWLTVTEQEEQLLNKMGIKAYSIYSLKGFLNYISSKISLTSIRIFSCNNLIKGKGTLNILLWHGIPLKGFKQYCKGMTEFVDYAITTSLFAAYIQASWLGVPVSKMCITGYPRNDVLLMPNASKRGENLLENIYGYSFKDKKVILYAPTYRVACNPNTKQCKHVHGCHPLPLLKMSNDEFYSLNKILEANNAVLIIRFHPVEELYILNIYRDIKEKYRNILILTTEDLLKLNSTIYDILPRVDVLITDYSSILFDYLLLNKPIMVYAYDLKEYASSASLITEYYNYEEILPGPLIQTPKSLLSTIREVLNDIDQYADKRQRIRKLFHRYVDSNSSERVWNKLIKPHIE